MFSGLFPTLPAACSWLFTLFKRCRKMLLFLNTKYGRKKKKTKHKKAHSLPGPCLFSLSSLLLLKAYFDSWRYLIQVTSDVWDSDTDSHWVRSCTGLIYLSIHLSIHKTIFLFLSHSSAIWSVLGIPYASFIELVSFPQGCFLPLTDFLFTPSHLPLHFAFSGPSPLLSMLPVYSCVTYSA